MIARRSLGIAQVGAITVDMDNEADILAKRKQIEEEIRKARMIPDVEGRTPLDYALASIGASEESSKEYVDGVKKLIAIKKSLDRGAALIKQLEAQMPALQADFGSLGNAPKVKHLNRVSDELSRIDKESYSPLKQLFDERKQQELNILPTIDFTPWATVLEFQLHIILWLVLNRPQQFASPKEEQGYKSAENIVRTNYSLVSYYKVDRQYLSEILPAEVLRQQTAFERFRDQLRDMDSHTEALLDQARARLAHEERPASQTQTTANFFTPPSPDRSVSGHSSQSSEQEKTIARPSPAKGCCVVM